MKIAVTGPNGFLGSRLIEGLKQFGHHVIPIARGDDPYKALQSVSSVFHTAAYYNPSPDFGDAAKRLVESNVDFTAAIADAAAYRGVRQVVYCATPRQDGPGDKPVGLYGASKLAGQLILESYPQFRTHTCFMGDMFGPGDNRNKVVQKIVEAAVMGEPVSIIPGKLINPISVAYCVEELCAGLTRSLPPVNLCGPPTTLGWIHAYVRNCVGAGMGTLFKHEAVNIPCNDPFPEGYSKFNSHYKTLARDLRLYVESYTKEKL